MSTEDERRYTEAYVKNLRGDTADLDRIKAERKRKDDEDLRRAQEKIREQVRRSQERGM